VTSDELRDLARRFITIQNGLKPLELLNILEVVDQLTAMECLFFAQHFEQLAVSLGGPRINYLVAALDIYRRQKTKRKIKLLKGGFEPTPVQGDSEDLAQKGQRLLIYFPRGWKPEEPLETRVADVGVVTAGWVIGLKTDPSLPQ